MWIGIDLLQSNPDPDRHQNGYLAPDPDRHQTDADLQQLIKFTQGYVFSDV
jgi:hypothetical protein